MMILFEQQGGNYQTKGDYFIPCVVTKDQKEVHIGVWANRHRQYLWTIIKKVDRGMRKIG